jgi:hypothetical protein
MTNPKNGNLEITRTQKKETDKNTTNQNIGKTKKTL